MDNRAAYKVSEAQLEDWLDYLAQHPALAKGIGMGGRSKEAMDRAWNQLADKLNAHGLGASKSGLRWKRYWADHKHKAKARASALRQEASGTGGGPSKVDGLTDTHLKILAIIGDAAVYGDTQHKIPVFDTKQIINSKEVDFSEEIIIEAVIDKNTPVLKAPSTRGHTDRIHCYALPPRATTETSVQPVTHDQHGSIMIIDDTGSSKLPEKSDHPIVQSHTSMSNSPWRTPAAKRRLFSHATSSTTKNPKKVEPAWLIDLENRRVRAEEKIAEAVFIMAEAAKIQAEASKLHAETMASIATALKDAIRK